MLLLVVAAAGILFFLNPTLLSAVSSYLPFPKELVAIRLLHNGKEVILLPNSQCVVNPRDSLQLLQVKTDGWVSWGTKVTAVGDRRPGLTNATQSFSGVDARRIL